MKNKKVVQFISHSIGSIKRIFHPEMTRKSKPGLTVEFIKNNIFSHKTGSQLRDFMQHTDFLHLKLSHLYILNDEPLRSPALCFLREKR